VLAQEVSLKTTRGSSNKVSLKTQTLEHLNGPGAAQRPAATKLGSGQPETPPTTKEVASRA